MIKLWFRSKLLLNHKSEKRNWERENRKGIKEALRAIRRIDQPYDFQNFINPFITLIILEFG